MTKSPLKVSECVSVAEDLRCYIEENTTAKCKVWHRANMIRVYVTNEDEQELGYLWVSQRGTPRATQLDKGTDDDLRSDVLAAVEEFINA